MRQDDHAIAGRAYLSGKIKRLFILAPKSIVTVWEEEFSEFADYPNTDILHKKGTDG